MKLLLEESSLTLKLSNEDLISLRDKGLIQQETRFLSSDFVLFVDVQQIKDLQADYDEDGLQLSIPAAFLEQLKSSLKLGFKSKFRNLTITIEKDF